MGCRDSFGELARRYQTRLLRYLQRYIRSTADAEDLLQEPFVRAFQRLNQYDPARSFGTWLFTLAHRLAVSHHRRSLVAARASEIIGQRGRDQEGIEPGNTMADEEATQF